MLMPSASAYAQLDVGDQLIEDLARAAMFRRIEQLRGDGHQSLAKSARVIFNELRNLHPIDRPAHLPQRPNHNPQRGNRADRQHQPANGGRQMQHTIEPAEQKQPEQKLRRLPTPAIALTTIGDKRISALRRNPRIDGGNSERARIMVEVRLYHFSRAHQAKPAALANGPLDPKAANDEAEEDRALSHSRNSATRTRELVIANSRSGNVPMRSIGMNSPPVASAILRSIRSSPERSANSASSLAATCNGICTEKVRPRGLGTDHRSMYWPIGKLTVPANRPLPAEPVGSRGRAVNSFPSRRISICSARDVASPLI